MDVDGSRPGRSSVVVGWQRSTFCPIVRPTGVRKDQSVLKHTHTHTETYRELINRQCGLGQCRQETPEVIGDSERGGGKDDDDYDKVSVRLTSVVVIYRRGRNKGFH